MKTALILLTLLISFNSFAISKNDTKSIKALISDIDSSLGDTVAEGDIKELNDVHSWGVESNKNGEINRAILNIDYKTNESQKSVMKCTFEIKGKDFTLSKCVDLKTKKEI